MYTEQLESCRSNPWGVNIQPSKTGHFDAKSTTYPLQAYIVMSTFKREHLHFFEKAFLFFENSNLTQAKIFVHPYSTQIERRLNQL